MARAPGRRQRTRRTRPQRSTEAYRHPRYPYAPDTTLAEDEVAHIHAEARRFLQEHGVRFLLPEARSQLIEAGATATDPHDDQLVRIPGELVDEAVRSVPDSFVLQGSRGYEVTVGGDHVVLMPVGGPPFVSDLDRGRRAGTLADFENFVRLTQAFDVLHANAPTVEAQDIAMPVRHMAITRAQLVLSDKVPWLYNRGRRRVADVFEMLRINAGVSAEEFRATPMCFSVVNTNSPRQIDVPMSGGIIDMARAGQPCIITPFTLAGAMAPASLAGALLLQHLEFLAGLTLSQVARPGAPVVYGGFTSNVDMRSGSPAFGTPEAIRGAIATGQLARHIGVPWRSSGSSTSPVEDAQGAWETAFNLQGAMRGGANVILHSAGWQEGGLVASFEKFILDIEILQTIVESWAPIPVNPSELAVDAIAEVGPGGHFFGSAHTLERFETAFYDPLVATRQNFEQWTEAGRPDARLRANAVWKQVLEDFEPPHVDEAMLAELDEFIARRTAEGGAPVD